MPGGVKDQVVPFGEVGESEVLVGQIRMLPKDFVYYGESLGGGDGWLGLQLKDDLLFCQRELPGEEPEFWLLLLPGDCDESIV